MTRNLRTCLIANLCSLLQLPNTVYLNDDAAVAAAKPYLADAPEVAAAKPYMADAADVAAAKPYLGPNSIENDLAWVLA